MSRRGAAMGRVALVAGGDSAEREISLRGAAPVQAALQANGVDVVFVDGARALLDAVAQGGIERVFNLLHGRGGEDGRLQGALSILEVPCTGSGVLGSALSMDKIQTKRIWQAEGLPTPAWRMATAVEQAPEIAEVLPAPWSVKPACEGSSVGMRRVAETGELGDALAAALRHDPRVLVETWIDGDEYTAGWLEEAMLPLIRIRPGGDHAFYDYDAKYDADDTQYDCPADLPADLSASLSALCDRARRALDCSGWGRVDFMLDIDSRPWLLEVNTVPGMTDHSLLPMAARSAGVDFEELVWRILNTA